MNPLLIAGLVLAGHPSLYYEPSDVPRYQEEATTTRAEIAQALEAGAGYASSTSPSDVSFEPDRGSALVAFSVSCMLSQDPTICQGAHSWVMQITQSLASSGAWEAAPDFIQGNYLIGLSVAYDVLSDGRLPSPLSADEQLQVRSMLIQGAVYFYDQATNGQLWYTPDYSQNHNWADYGALGVAALAVKGEDPAADDWLKLVVDDYAKVGEVLARIPDGTWHEGYSYEGSSLAAWLWFAAALRHAEQMGRVDPSTPDFTDNPLLRAFGHYRAVGSLPGRMYQHILTHGDFFGWSSDETVMVLRYIAARFGDGEAAWLAEQQLNDMPHSTYGYEQSATALEYLVFDPSVAVTPPSAQDDYLSDLAGEISRSGYDANAAVLGVKCGAFGGLGNWEAMATGAPPGGELDFGHDHVDDLGFWFYANGEWLAPEAAGYVTHPTPTAGYPLAYNTDFHNSLTVDGVGQIGDNGWAETTSASNIDFSRVGAVLAHLATPDSSYVEMDGLHLYPASLELDTVRRQVLFVHRGIVVVRDQLHAQSAHQFEWNSHAMDGAVKDGSWIQAIGKNDQALAVRVLAPSSWAFSTDEQTPQEINAPFDGDGNITHFKVAAAPATGARFLVAMEPTTQSGWSARPDIQPLGDPDSASGFTLADGSRWALGDDPSSAVQAGTLALVGTVGGVSPAGSGTRYLLIRGSSFSDGSTALLSGDAQDGALEVTVANATVEVHATGATQLRVLAPNATAATWNGQPASVARDPRDARYVLINSTAPAPSGSGSGSGNADAGAPPPLATSDGGFSPAPTHPTTGCSSTGGGFILASLFSLCLLLGRRRALLHARYSVMSAPRGSAPTGYPSARSDWVRRG